ncbi:MAG: hypothetical protein JSS99_14040 [Actinobacteria bacterium]|nr:hypothetical protein [Actinomycetota bacterium]
MTMRNTAALVVVLAAAALGLLAGSAGATESVAFEPGRSITASGTLTMTAEVLSMRCPVTLSGSFATGSLAATRGTQWGSVSRFTWTRCSGGELNAALSLPWPFRFRSFPAEYPAEARSVTLDLGGVALQGTLFSTCLYSGTVGQQIGLSPEGELEEAWRTGSVTELAEERLSLVSGAGCPSTARVSGTLTLTPQQNVRRFIGRLSIIGGSIPVGATEASVVMSNTSPVTFPEVGVATVPLTPLEIIGAPTFPTDNAEMFRIKEERNFCQNTRLPPGGSVVCNTDIRYIETAARPKTAHMRIAAELGGVVRSTNWPLRAE